MDDSLNSSWSGEDSLKKANGTFQFSPFHPVEMLTIQVCHGFFGVAGFIENVCAIIVILRHRLTVLDFPSNRFILNLAIADAVSCLATIAVVVCITISRKFTIFCAVIQFTLLASSGNLSILTYDRFLSVYSSLKYPTIMTMKRAVCLQFVPWIMATILSALSIWSKPAGIPYMVHVKNLYYTISILVVSACNTYMFKKARDKRNDERNVVLKPKDRNYRLHIRLLIVNLLFLDLVFQ